MNDNSKNVRGYIYEQLNGNITVMEGSAEASTDYVVPIVAKATDLTTYPYIVVRTSNFIDESLKDKFYGTYEVEIQIHTRFPLNYGGQDDADDISNSVLQLIRNHNTTVEFLGEVDGEEVVLYTMFIFKQTNQRYIQDDDGQYDYYQKTLVFECKVISNE